MRRRTRRHRHRQIINFNKLGFICLILSMLIVCTVFSVPKMIISKISANKKIKPVSEVEETVVYKDETPKYYSDVETSSHKFTSKYDDITKLETKAKKELENATNDGKISAEDYSTKNITSSFGSVSIRNTTKNTNVNIEEYLNKKISADVVKDKPAVLIYHTHTLESYQILENSFYSNSLLADAENYGVIRVGDALCETIEAQGFKVIHDKTVYDESFNGAFDRSRESVSKILRDNPSIQVVIDLHRDSISKKDGTKIKTITEVSGKKIAQIQITAGCEDGFVTGFKNWEKNLTFALHLQKEISASYPKAIRPLFFCSRKYNMDLVPCAVNIDIGTDSNTIRESVYSAELLGEAVVNILKECENND